MASQQVAGAQAKGVYAFMKHFALNDQETNRLSELATWANEQSIREIYLKPFEMSVKQGGAGAVMSAFNYIGMEWGRFPLRTAQHCPAWRVGLPRHGPDHHEVPQAPQTGRGGIGSR